RKDLPLNMPQDTAVARWSIVPRDGRPPIVWEIGSVPTRGPITTRRRTLDATTAAAAGVDWALLNEYMVNSGRGGLVPATDWVTYAAVGPLVAQSRYLSQFSDPQYFPRGIWPKVQFTGLRFEVSGYDSNPTPPLVIGQAPPGTLSAYVGV